MFRACERALSRAFRPSALPVGSAAGQVDVGLGRAPVQARLVDGRVEVGEGPGDEVVGVVGEEALRVGVAQAADVQRHLGDLMADCPWLEFVEVVADAQIADDACVAECELGIVESSLSAQLEAIRAAMREALDQAHACA